MSILYRPSIYNVYYTYSIVGALEWSLSQWKWFRGHSLHNNRLYFKKPLIYVGKILGYRTLLSLQFYLLKHIWRRGLLRASETTDDCIGLFTRTTVTGRKRSRFHQTNLAVVEQKIGRYAFTVVRTAHRIVRLPSISPADVSLNASDRQYKGIGYR